jgi:hypothetical protein
MAIREADMTTPVQTPLCHGSPERGLPYMDTALLGIGAALTGAVTAAAWEATVGAPAAEFLKPDTSACAWPGTSMAPAVSARAATPETVASLVGTVTRIVAPI